jgi:hypothetical protein
MIFTWVERKKALPRPFSNVESAKYYLRVKFQENGGAEVTAGKSHAQAAHLLQLALKRAVLGNMGHIAQR